MPIEERRDLQIFCIVSGLENVPEGASRSEVRVEEQRWKRHHLRENSGANRIEMLTRLHAYIALI